MARRVFYSFHHEPDCWRASQIRNIGVIEGNRPASDNDWQSITRGGDVAIQRWIDAQMEGRTCAVVLIGSATAGRKWIDYEIKKAWREGMGLLGIHVHNLEDRHGKSCAKGANPFAGYTLNGHDFASIVKTYDPFGWNSKQVYANICANLGNWIEDAINIRTRH